MLEVFTHGSPNGHKVTIALEELGLRYELHHVNVFAGEGQRPEFLALNPAGKIPVLRDTDTGVVTSESCAILLYLADKAGRLVPRGGVARSRALELLFLQASLQGPMFGQRSYFSLFASEAVPHAIERYEQQGARIDRLVDTLLAEDDYLLGADFSIVDVAFYGWYYAAERSGFLSRQHERLVGWFERISARPAVQRGVKIPNGLPELPPRKLANAPPPPV